MRECFARIADCFGDTEIYYTRVVVTCENDVAGLQVAVDDRLSVSGAQRTADLSANLGDGRGLEGAFVFQPFLDGLSFDVFHDDKRNVIRCFT